MASLIWYGDNETWGVEQWNWKWNMIEQERWGTMASETGTTRRVPVEREIINVYDVFEI